MSKKVPNIVPFLEKLYYIPDTSEPVVLAPSQKAFLEYAFRLDDNNNLKYRNIIYSTIKKSGKALALDTPIRTRYGWKNIVDIVIGDEVYDINGKLSRVSYVSEVFLNHRCAKIEFSNNESIVADFDHAWQVESKIAPKSFIEYIKKEELSHVTLCTTEQLMDIVIYENQFNHRIKLSPLSIQSDESSSVDIKLITEVESVPVKCIEIESESHLFLAGKTLIPTHNTETGAMIAAWYVFSGVAVPMNEVYVLASDFDQAQGRVYKALRRSIEMSPMLMDACTKVQDKIILLKNGTTIIPLAGDYAGAAGSNPGLSLWDELWTFTKENQRRLYDEVTPPPTRKNSLRVITTYAGIKNESELLENIYDKMVKPENRIDLGKFKNTVTGEMTPLLVYEKGDTLCMWEHEPRMPWQSASYYEEQRSSPGFRESAYKRVHQNLWVENECGLEMDEWDKCVDLGKQFEYSQGSVPVSREITIGVGIDAATVKDRASVTSVFRKNGKFWLGQRKYWQPSKEEPLNFENTIEKYVIELNDKYFLCAVYYDPWQMESTAQRLRDKGIPMIPWTQTQTNTIIMCENLLDQLRETNLVLYEDEELTKEAKMISVKEVPARGRRFIKDNPNKKIDSIISLSMACLAASRHAFDWSDFGSQIMMIPLRRQ